MDVMMGDLVLTEDEVNPVMSALLDNGLDVTALHNHFFFDTPRIFYMHVHGMGTAADLATKVKPALDADRQAASAQPRPQRQPGARSTATLDTRRAGEDRRLRRRAERRGLQDHDRPSGHSR